MAREYGAVSIRVIEAPSIAEVVKCFRIATGRSVTKIQRNVRAREPLFVGQFYGVDHDEVARRTFDLLDRLKHSGAVVEILFDGATVSRESLEDLRWQPPTLAGQLPSSDRTEQGLYVNIGGIPVDLNAGMIEAVTNPPAGFVSKHTFIASDVTARLWAIDWFARCGKPVSLDVTMELSRVRSWPEAINCCKRSEWENAELEARNQLTIFLHIHDRKNYQQWNKFVDDYKNSVVGPLIVEKIVPYQTKYGLDIAFVDSVSWHILGMLMENTYLSSKHRAFFFLELLMVYEAGHFPCGWEGEWPQGRLIVF